MRFTGSDVNHVQKRPPRHTPNTGDQVAGCPAAPKVTYNEPSQVASPLSALDITRAQLTGSGFPVTGACASELPE